MVKKTKKKKIELKPRKEALAHLNKTLRNVKDKNLKDDLSNLLQDSDFTFSGGFEFTTPGISFQAPDEDFDVKVVRREEPKEEIELEKVLAKESPGSKKDDKKDSNYTTNNVNYNQANEQEDSLKYNAISNYNAIQSYRDNDEEYLSQSAISDTRSEEHKKASVSNLRNDKLSEITSLSGLEATRVKDVGVNLIGESTLDANQYKLGSKSRIDKGKYARKYE